MRICHVIESSSGGSSRVVAGLLRHQLAAGDDVSLIYSPVRAEPIFTNEVAALQPKLHVHTLPMRREVGLHDIGAAWRLWRLLSKLGPFDIVHGHSSKAGALTRIAGVALRTPVVVYTPHAFVTLAPDASRIYGGVEWLAAWFCDAVVVGSKQEYRHARETLRLPASRLQLIPMGVDLSRMNDRAAARASLGLSEEAFVVGFVGRIVPQKNPLRLARVFGLVASARPDLRFVVVGDGELFDAFSAELRAQKVADRTALAPHADGRDVMAAFDCLVCTSDYESFGLIFPEALAVGAPIVAPPVGVAEEAVVTGETGFITSFDAGDIAKAVLALAARSPEERQRMALACRERARIFDSDATSSRTRRLYEALIAAKEGRGK
ncbi:MAG: glycosyltransferase [Methylocystis sp.]